MGLKQGVAFGMTEKKTRMMSMFVRYLVGVQLSKIVLQRILSL
jgi:hypothetical protein